MTDTVVHFLATNGTGKRIPQYGIVKLLSSASTMNGRPLHTVEEPTVDDPDGTVYVISASMIDADDSTVAYRFKALQYAERVYVGDNSVSFGDEIGPVDGFAASTEGLGLRCVGPVTHRSVRFLSIGGGGGSGSTGDCCITVTSPDMTHPGTGIQTLRRWQVSKWCCCTREALGPVTKTYLSDGYSDGGSVTWPGGQPIVVWDATEEKWIADISAELVVSDETGYELTTGFTASGTIEVTLTDGGDYLVEVILEATFS